MGPACMKRQHSGLRLITPTPRSTQMQMGVLPCPYQHKQQQQGRSKGSRQLQQHTLQIQQEPTMALQQAALVCLTGYLSSHGSSS